MQHILNNKASTFGRIQKLLYAYHKKYRNSALRPLRVSGLYALFPPKSKPPFKLIGSWPDLWPNVDSAGVYVIFDASLNPLYVGKTSLRQNFGSRFYDWFCRERDTGGCRVRGVWSHKPAYVATIPVQLPFEAPSLEEYLIHKLRPSDNQVGARTR